MGNLHLPTLNAILNFTSAVLLGLGFYFIKKKNIEAHRKAMTGAFVVSSIFLASYLFYHFMEGSTRFQGIGPARTIYFIILISHTILAAAAAPLAIATFWKGLRGQVESHKKIAKITWPIWIYVSITGVVIYWMLYRMTFATG